MGTRRDVESEASFVDDLDPKAVEGWLTSAEVLKPILDIRRNGGKCYFAVDYCVLHDYLFPSYEDIVSPDERTQHDEWRKLATLTLLFERLPRIWQAPLLLLEPYQVELKNKLCEFQDNAVRVMLSTQKREIRDRIKTHLRRLTSESTDTGLLQKNMENEGTANLREVLEKLKSFELLYLLLTVGTRRSLEKLSLLLGGTREGSQVANLQLKLPDELSALRLSDHWVELEPLANEALMPKFKDIKGDRYFPNKADSMMLTYLNWLNAKLREKNVPDRVILITTANAFFEVISRERDSPKSSMPEITGGAVPLVIRPEFALLYRTLTTFVTETTDSLDDRLYELLVETTRTLESLKDVLRFTQGTVEDTNLHRESRNKLRQVFDNQRDCERLALLLSSGNNKAKRGLYWDVASGVTKYLKEVEENLRSNYQNLIEKVASAEEEFRAHQASILASIMKHYKDSVKLSAFCAFLDHRVRSLNYDFLYKETSVEGEAAIVFSGGTEGLPETLLKVFDNMENGSPSAYLLSAHLLTKVNLDEEALSDVATGTALAKEKKRIPLLSPLCFVKNIALIHLFRFREAISLAENQANHTRESEVRSRFLLQLGYIYWMKWTVDKKPRTEDIELAIKYCESALNIAPNQRCKALAMANLSKSYLDQGLKEKEDSPRRIELVSFALRHVKPIERILEKSDWGPPFLQCVIGHVRLESIRNDFHQNRLNASEAINKKEAEVHKYFETCQQMLSSREINSRRIIRQQYSKFITSYNKFKPSSHTI
jgi:hypothetical protein